MKTIVILLLLTSVSQAQSMKLNIPYSELAHERHVLDIYAPHGAKKLPVVFWIHGGGWQTGDKTDVQIKPRVFSEKGFVFVAPNYRLLPHVQMDVLIGDVAKALGWVHQNIDQHGGDPNRIFVMGHSAGAQLASLLCIDHRYVNAAGVPVEALKGCVPVDGDTYDIPAIITTAEMRQISHGLPLPQFGHRQKFGNDPVKHIDFSAVTHVKKGKGIPPFLIVHVAENPNTAAQAQRLSAVLHEADVSAKIFRGKETTHRKVNEDIGLPDDKVTQELFEFLQALVGE